jgi:phage gp46-like protein
MNYDGDVMLRHTEDGGSITITLGQPEMETGLWTAVYVSMFTTPGWWGNIVAGENEDIGSECEELERHPLTNKTRLDYEVSVRNALAWIVSAGIAKAVTVEASIIGINALAVTILIEEPDGNVETLRYKVNWQGQRAALGVS